MEKETTPQEEEKTSLPKQTGKTCPFIQKPKLLIGIIVLLLVIILLLLFLILRDKRTTADTKVEETKTSKEEKKIEPTVHCPEEYEIEGDVCERKATKPASSSLVCPEGMIEVGPDGPCGLYKQKAEPTQRCPMGTIYQVEIKTLYYCYTQSRKPESCGEDPESSYLADGKCYYARIDSETTYTCPDNMVSYKGDCYTKAEKIKKYSCDSGYTLQGTNCVKTERTEQMKECPTGYELDGEKCVVEE
ncbi:MAG: hypothetical protein ACOX0R_03650 [Candidatus Dojkabacteria bacterium]|jgi:hypothetical protein